MNDGAPFPFYAVVSGKTFPAKNAQSDELSKKRRSRPTAVNYDPHGSQLAFGPICREAQAGEICPFFWQDV